jgi:hypothetical protein
MDRNDEKMNVSAVRPVTARRTQWMVVAVLIIATLVRLHSIGFGLPALYDPDEPLFILAALKLLRDQTLNPGWFGHPGSTTIYALALIDVGIIGGGVLGGRFPNAEAFATAVYADPGLVVLPGRLFILLCGVLCVAMTFLIGRRLFGDRAGLIAAAIIALDPLHVQQSQIIRTDVHASLFMLAAIFFSIGIVRRGRWRDYLLAGAMIGLAIATKWPAATFLVAPIGACLLRAKQQSMPLRAVMVRLAAIGGMAVGAMLFASPYLALDYPTLVANLQGEARPRHLGSTGGGFLFNLGWYLWPTMTHSIGVPGVLLAMLGLGVMVVRRQWTALVVLGPPFALFLVAIAAQSLLWARWIIPLLPIMALYAAAGLCAMADGIARSRWGTGSIAAGLSLLLLAPMAFSVLAESRARMNDTRTQASAWAKAHFAPGSTIAVEHLAFDLLPQGWHFLFPAGVAGCIDGNAVLKGKVQVTSTDRWKGKGRAILDFGTVDPGRLDSCVGDYAILSHYDRYRDEAARYPAELAAYRHLLARGRVIKSFTPQPGLSSGPVVRIVQFTR